MLTEKRVVSAKSTEKQYKLTDGEGMYLLVCPNGAKYWRLKYYFAGRERLMSIGVYPKVSIAEARRRRAKARLMLADGKDPSAERRAEKIQVKLAAKNTLQAIAEEWHANNEHTWSDDYSAWVLRALRNDVFPWLGQRPIAEIKSPELLQAIRRIESRDAIVTAHRVRNNLEQIWAFAISAGAAERNPASEIRKALKKMPAKTHYASVKDPESVGELLRALRGYKGSPITRAALQLAPLVFVRPGELRKAEWAEFNLDAAEWRIPAERMKRRAPHVVPLSRQAIAILRDLQPLTGSGRFAFPGKRDRKAPMGESTINAALRRLNYGSDEMTAHGFRSMASTILNEQKWHRDAIERQLAHGEKDKVRAAYNAAEHMDERRRMMQAWADYLDDLRTGANVVPMKKAAA